MGRNASLPECSPLGVEQNRNRNFEQKPKLVPVQLGCNKYRHTGYNFQEESIKTFSFALTFTFHFLNKCTGRIYSFCFLHENCGPYAGISCIPIEQEPILVFARSFGFGFCSTPSLTLPAIVKASSKWDVNRFRPDALRRQLTPGDLLSRRCL